MTETQERRDPKAQRVAVSTLVEICGNEPGIPSFEAQSVNVSQSGMQLRTAYLPEQGAPLVCRFESEGREILVEGNVAWRRESGRGGEFGVMFTALDSRGVDALKALCVPEPSPAEDQPRIGEAGARVRLHIEGLGSPMKARVQNGGEHRLQVGSSLEFLKVGRRLEIEDVERGARRSAQIDTVSVLVDPSTQIPELVVSLRFEGAAETTPSPSTASVVSAGEPDAHVLRIPAESVSTDAKVERSARSAADANDADDDAADADPEIRGRVASFAVNAGEHMKVAGERFAKASSVFAEGAGGWIRDASERVSRWRSQRNSSVPRRTTAPPPGGPLSSDKRSLRPQNAAQARDREREASKRWSRPGGKKLAVTIGVGALGMVGLVSALRATSAPPPGAASAAERPVIAELGAPPAAAPTATATPAATASAQGTVTAAVPLFGPTPLATLEPAPLGPPPGSAEQETEELEKAESEASLSTGVEDQRFSERKPTTAAVAAAAPTKPSAKTPARPEDVRAWGRGRMHLPTIHRLRLDAPGAALDGSPQPTGFLVVVPGRKVMEAAAGIAKRDARIARTRVTNTGAGAQIVFQFKGDVPPYRVRLRRDYVEFLISAPEVTDTKKKH